MLLLRVPCIGVLLVQACRSTSPLTLPSLAPSAPASMTSRRYFFALQMCSLFDQQLPALKHHRCCCWLCQLVLQRRHVKRQATSYYENGLNQTLLLPLACGLLACLQGVLTVTIFKASGLTQPGSLLAPDPYAELVLVDCDRRRWDSSARLTPPSFLLLWQWAYILWSFP